IIAIIALIGMNILTILIGNAIPLLLYKNFIDWVAIILFFIFSVFLFEEAYTMESKTLKARYDKYLQKHERVKISKSFKRANSEEGMDLKAPLVSEEDQENQIPPEEGNKMIWTFFSS